MTRNISQPGISRADRLSAEGLKRLENHLRNGAAISAPVLAQWIKRYGEPARALIKRYGQYRTEFDGL